MIAGAALRIAAPLAGRDFRWLWCGQAISALGDPLQAAALAWLVLDRTGSPVALSAVFLALGLPRALLTLLGGVLTDRADPRRVMLWSDGARALLLGAVVALALADALPLWGLVGLLAAHGAAGGVFAPAAGSIVPRVVPPERLQAANALQQMTPQIAMVLGAPLAGLLVAGVGPLPALALNAASFAVAALAATAMAPQASRDGGTRAALLAEGRQGLEYVRREPWLLALLLVDAVLSLAAIGPLAVGLPLLARGEVAFGARGLGLLLAAFGGGSLAGLLVAGGRAPAQRRGRAFCLLHLAQAPLFAALVWASLPLAALCLAAVGLLNGVVLVLYLALIQERVAAALLGRIMSLVALAGSALVPLSQLVSGLVAQVAGPRPLFLGAGALLLAGALGGLLTPALRRVE